MKLSNILYYISFYIFVIFQSLALSQWIQLNSGTTDYLYSIDFINHDTGFVAGDYGIILKTTDAGSSWNQNYSDSTIIFYDIKFANERIGFVVGYSTSSSGILKTTNGGSDWFELDFGTHYAPFTIFCVDSNVVHVGGYRYLAKTIDGGLTWGFQDIGNTEVNSIFFLNYNIGFAALSGSIYKTSNGGVTWYHQKTCGYSLSSIYFINDNIGFAIGGSITVLPHSNAGLGKRTTNGGSTWEDINPLNHYVESIVFITPYLGYCCGYDMDISKTTNGGVSWQSDDIPGIDIVGILESIETTINSDETADVYAVGVKGIILKKSGISSVQPDGTNIRTFLLSQNFPNPFNPSTKIEYQVPEMSSVSIKIYDLLGKEIKTLINEEKPAGNYEVEFDGTGLPSGIYFYQLKAGGYVETKKMVLLR